MSNYNDYILVNWKDLKNNRTYIIGKLSKDTKYYFEYGFEIKDALQMGFDPLLCFNDITQTYISDKLFYLFSSRLPNKRRKDISDILHKYKLSKYDEYELLKNCGGRLPIDNLGFINPINL